MLYNSKIIKILINSGLVFFSNKIGFHVGDLEKDMKTRPVQQELTEVSECLKTFEGSRKQMLYQREFSKSCNQENWRWWKGVPSFIHGQRLKHPKASTGFKEKQLSPAAEEPRNQLLLDQPPRSGQASLWHGSVFSCSPNPRSVLWSVLLPEAAVPEK